MVQPHKFALLYEQYDSPITKIDCGKKCAPYNPGGAPFCCDTLHAVPSAYTTEWVYLSENTDLWHPWSSTSPEHAAYMRESTPEGQVLIECLGYAKCQRNFRSIACRSFPFFPYVTLQGEFIGISYYWEYEDRCWVISHLAQVTPSYLAEILAAYDMLFDWYPDERAEFRGQSIRMRQVFGRTHRAIPLLARNGAWYKVSPRSGRMRRTNPARLPLFGVYAVADRLKFAGE